MLPRFCYSPKQLNLVILGKKVSKYLASYSHCAYPDVPMQLIFCLDSVSMTYTLNDELFCRSNLKLLLYIIYMYYIKLLYNRRVHTYHTYLVCYLSTYLFVDFDIIKLNLI